MNEDIFFYGAKALIHNSEDKVLVLKKDKNLWDMPGGRIAKGEVVEETLRRELFEEIGLDVTFGTKYIGTILTNIRIPLNSLDLGLIVSFYHCKLDYIPNIILSSEHIDFEWCTIDYALSLLAEKYSDRFLKIINAFYKTS